MGLIINVTINAWVASISDAEFKVLQETYRDKNWVGLISLQGRGQPFPLQTSPVH